MDYNRNFDDQSELYTSAKGFLNPDEQLLWIDRPCRTVKPRISLYNLIFSVFWLVFAIFWTVSVTLADGVAGLLGLPFLLVGVFMLYGSGFPLRTKLKKTVYMVTDRRAVIITKTFRGLDCHEYFFNYMSTVSLSNVKGNTGNICFRRFDGYYNDGWKRGYRSKPMGFDLQTSFIGIDNVQSVYRLISDQISNGSRDSQI